MTTEDLNKAALEAEIQEWRDALATVVEYADVERAEHILKEVAAYAKQLGVRLPEGIHTPYMNTIPEDQEAKIPSDAIHMEKLLGYLRWNAIAMVMRAGHKKEGLGGHLGSYAAIAVLFEVGLNYFFHAKGAKDCPLGDLVLFQGHSAEGLYARAYLEGRIDEAHLNNFRQEALVDGLSSYPHPYLMPDFWDLPSVSLGLGPLMGIYQAQFQRYLQHRSLADTACRHVWVFVGDGEMSEVDSTGALIVASRDKLDNLIFVVNCNMQRLDGPVSGNGRIIQDFEGIFRGAGWHVIKTIWGGNWMPLFAKDSDGFLKKRIEELVDGEWQAYMAQGGSALREGFFGKYPELLALIEGMSDQELENLLSAGHDPQKVYAAYAAAIAHKGQPIVILAQSVKGYALGPEGQGRNVAHNVESINFENLQAFAKRFNLPLTDKQIKNLDFIKPKANSEEMRYMQERRKALGGYMPARRFKTHSLEVPELDAFSTLLEGFGEREISSNMAFIRVLGVVLKDKNINERVVPIVADEARTLGMEGLFRQIGIYAPEGQKYTPEDSKQLLYYKEDKTGQLMQQGITEAGAMATWIAAGTSYSANDLPMIPFYIYYSMFGYQRVGDLVWAAGDLMAQGFLVGAIAGRTTLPGEGLQHQDGQNLVMFANVPSCITYDPCFAYEIAVIVQDGLRRMYQENEKVFYYFTVMNESYQHPPMPKGAEQGILKGLYCFAKSKKKVKHRVQLLGSGAILREVIAAAELLEKEFAVSADVWSATSFNELQRDLKSVDRFNRLNPDKKAKVAYITECLGDDDTPVVAATDYMRIYAEQVATAIKQPYYILGTDGFGRSDSRANLRDFFEVNANMIAYTALFGLYEQGKLTKEKIKAARKKLKIDPKRPDPWLS